MQGWRGGRRARPRPPPPPSPPCPAAFSSLPSPSATLEGPPQMSMSPPPPHHIERRIDHFLERFRKSTAMAMEQRRQQEEEDDEDNNHRRNNRRRHNNASTKTPPSSFPFTMFPVRRSRSALFPTEISPMHHRQPVPPTPPPRQLPQPPTATPRRSPLNLSPAALTALPLFLRRSLPAFYYDPPSHHQHHQHHSAAASTFSSSASSCGSASSATSIADDLSDDGMDDSNSALSVRDVADLLYARYAILSGGKSRDGCPIITFPDYGNFYNLSDEDYRRLMTYLTSVPALEDSDLGFVLIIDRRSDKWNSVKTVLLKISGYFPGLIHIIYVLRPAGFFQKAISEVSNKLFKEEFKFRVVVCNCVEELHEHVDRNQLTKDLDGCIAYNHEIWIDQRLAVEKFSINTHEISMALRNYTQRLQETEFPNDAISTEELLQVQGNEYRELKEDLHSASHHGEALLEYIRKPVKEGGESCPDKLINVTAIERLLLQLEETERMFDEFWQQHEGKLKRCLELRRFEQDFRELQSIFDINLRRLADMTEVGDSVAHIDALLKETMVFQEQCLDELEKAEDLRSVGLSLVDRHPEVVDSVQPKCVELQRVAELFRERIGRRLESLRRGRELHERIEKANKWCTQGVELLASQQMEQCSSPKFAEMMLAELEDFLASASDLRIATPKESRNMFHDMVTPDTKALVQQVLQRIDDIQTMCEKRKSSLRILAVRQQSSEAYRTAPKPHLMSYAHTNGNLEGHSNTPKSPKIFRKAKTVPKLETPNRDRQERRNSSSPDSEGSFRDSDALRAKRGHVLTELLATERIYVAELRSILLGYQSEMMNPEAQSLLPPLLMGKSDYLFGNLDDIHKFHDKVFLCDLENCISSPELIGLCFLQRRDAFHQLYSRYCQNHPQSEALRREMGEQNPFFVECQRKLGHKLPLGAYLLKPVQRITKYQLLLKDLIKYSEEGKGYKELQEALDCMLAVLKCVNDSMHQVAITGFPGNLSEQGRLLLQGSFRVWSESKKDRLKDLRLKPRQRHIFLYTQAIVFCKKAGRDPDKVSYQFKNYLKMSQVGMTEMVQRGRGDQRRFELWLQGRQEVYTLQAPSLEIKEAWIGAVKRLLFEQLEHLRGQSIRHFTAKMQAKGGSGTNTAINGITRPHPVSPPLGGHKPLRHTSSWDYSSQSNNNVPELNFGRRLRLMSMQEGASNGSGSMVSGGPVPSAGGSSGDSQHPSCDEEEGWSTEYSNSDDDDITDPFTEPAESYSNHYVVLADYIAMDHAELSLREGDLLDLLKVGCAGWWFVRLLGSGQEGWAPSAYLGRMSKTNRSSPSVSSQDSGMGILLNGASGGGGGSSVGGGSSGISLDGGSRGLRHATSRTSVTSIVSSTSHD